MLKFLPDELRDVPFVVDGCANTLEERMVLWRIAAKLAPTAEWAEFGCGTSTGRLLELLPKDGRLHCFDSEQGLPEPWPRGTDIKPAGSYARGIPTADQRAKKRPGWFKDTLKHWSPNPLGLIHIDCDIYSSTVQALAGCTPFCRNGTVLAFDELYGYPTYTDHEWKATQEWLSAAGWSMRWVARGHYQVVGVIQC